MLARIAIDTPSLHALVKTSVRWFASQPVRQKKRAEITIGPLSARIPGEEGSRHFGHPGRSFLQRGAHARLLVLHCTLTVRESGIHLATDIATAVPAVPARSATVSCGFQRPMSCTSQQTADWLCKLQRHREGRHTALSRYIVRRRARRRLETIKQGRAAKDLVRNYARLSAAAHIGASQTDAIMCGLWNRFTRFSAGVRWRETLWPTGSWLAVYEVPAFYFKPDLLAWHHAESRARP